MPSQLFYSPAPLDTLPSHARYILDAIRPCHATHPVPIMATHCTALADLYCTGKTRHAMRHATRVDATIRQVSESENKASNDVPIMYSGAVTGREPCEKNPALVAS